MNNSLCDINNSCFIAIDIQEKLMAAIPPRVTTRVVNNTIILLTATARLNIPVLTTAQYPQGLGPMEQAVSAVLPETSRHFDKTAFSCMNAEGFSDHLKSLNKKQLVLVGLEAHICVLQSAFEMVHEGHEVFVVIDATASRKVADYDSAIMRMKQAGITIINTESVLFEWLRDAAHPQFKTLSKHIR